MKLSLRILSVRSGDGYLYFRHKLIRIIRHSKIDQRDFYGISREVQIAALHVFQEPLVIDRRLRMCAGKLYGKVFSGRQ